MTGQASSTGARLAAATAPATSQSHSPPSAAPPVASPASPTPRSDPTRHVRDVPPKDLPQLATLAAVIALLVVADLKWRDDPAPKGYAADEVQAAVVAASDVHKYASNTYLSDPDPKILAVTHDHNGNYIVDLTIWIYGLSAQQGAEKELIVTVSPGFQIVNEQQVPARKP